MSFLKSSKTDFKDFCIFVHCFTQNFHPENGASVYESFQVTPVFVVAGNTGLNVLSLNRLEGLRRRKSNVFLQHNILTVFFGVYNRFYLDGGTQIKRCLTQSYLKVSNNWHWTSSRKSYIPLWPLTLKSDFWKWYRNEYQWLFVEQTLFMVPISSQVVALGASWISSSCNLCTLHVDWSMCILKRA